jgi:thiol-disulfide isomerase/thioredoxin
MSIRKISIFIAVVMLVTSLALAAYEHGRESSVSADADNKNTTMALPDKTNNAWELQPFRLEGLDGKQHALDEWKGKVIILNFWASWCAPCQYEIPDLVALQKKYGAKGLQVVGIGLDEARKLGNVKRTLGINYPVLVAPQASNARLLSRWGNDRQIVPYTVVIDRDSTLVYIHRGQLSNEAVADYIVPLVAADGLAD